MFKTLSNSVVIRHLESISTALDGSLMNMVRLSMYKLIKSNLTWKDILYKVVIITPKPNTGCRASP